jgi:transcriptional regulator with XRE-family HTH domain
MSEKRADSDFAIRRRAVRWSQAKVARLFGVSESAVRRWDQGKPVQPCANVLMKMLFEEIVNGRRDVVRDYMNAVRERRPWP